MSVDKKSRQATFRGGTTFKEVNAILDKYGLAMTMLGSVSDQTVAGAIATGKKSSLSYHDNMMANSVCTSHHSE